MKTHALPVTCQRFAAFTAICAALVLATASSQAQFLIYKGTARFTADVTNPFPRSAVTFEVIDLNTSTLSAVTGLVLGGQKVQFTSDPAEFRIAQAPLTKGQTATTISLARTSGGSNDSFSNLAFHFRGKNTTLRTTSGVGGNPVIFPRLIVGGGTNDQAFNGTGAFVEQKVLLAYQEARTITANSDNQTIEQVLKTLSVELEAKGFKLPTP